MTDLTVLIDQLVPAPPSATKRVLTAAVVIIGGVGLALAYISGFLVPQPTYNNSSYDPPQIGPAPDGEHVIIAAFWFNNYSGTDLSLTAIEVDAPGLVVDRVTWGEYAYVLVPGEQDLPVAMPRSKSVAVTLWARPETCVDPEPGERWGVVRGRWEYQDRPSWWHRWEDLDTAIAGPDLTALDADGNPFAIDGPLSGACALLEERP